LLYFVPVYQIVCWLYRDRKLSVSLCVFRAPLHIDLSFPRCFGPFGPPLFLQHRAGACRCVPLQIQVICLASPLLHDDVIDRLHADFSSRRIISPQTLL
jgi:hypothetical protein